VKRKVHSTASKNTDTAVGLSNGNSLADIPRSFSWDPIGKNVYGKNVHEGKNVHGNNVN